MTLDLDILENSFDLIAPRGDELVDIFYVRLFEAAPAVQPLFAHTDLRKQKAMLLATLVLLRKSLRDLEAIAPKLRQLGARHVAYGARPEHYPVVAEVMLASMAEIAGEAWTPEIAAAWADALGLVAAAMLEGAEEAEAKSARRDRPRISAAPAVSPAYS
jgi:hemoglobin-like flavoprotein